MGSKEGDGSRMYGTLLICAQVVLSPGIRLMTMAKGRGGGGGPELGLCRARTEGERCLGETRHRFAISDPQNKMPVG